MKIKIQDGDVFEVPFQLSFTGKRRKGCDSEQKCNKGHEYTAEIKIFNAEKNLWITESGIYRGLFKY